MRRLVERLLSRRKPGLLTLTGPSGIGKTRLAHELKQYLEPHYSAVWFVPLQDLSRPRLLADAVRRAILISSSWNDPGARKALHLLGAASEGGMASSLERHLLVLDGWTQPEAEGARKIRLLMDEGCACVVTAREPLRLQGEECFPLAPLELPDKSRNYTEQMSAPSWQLFAWKMPVTMPPDLVPGPIVEEITDLCIALKGNPLAIEIAASQTRVRTPEQIKQEMSSRLAGLEPLETLLTLTGDRFPRPLQRFFACLSVFRGGWSPLAAATVCQETESASAREWRLEADHYLDALCAAHLVRVEETGIQKPVRTPPPSDSVERWFQYRAPVGKFAERWLDPLKAREVSERHALYFLNVAVEAANYLRGPDQGNWLDRLEMNYSNLAAAMRWFARENAPSENGLRLTSALVRFWMVRQEIEEGYECFQAAIEHPGAASHPLLYAQALRGYARMHNRFRLDPALECCTESERVLQKLAESEPGPAVQAGKADTVYMKGSLLLGQVYYAKTRDESWVLKAREAQSYLAESIRLFEELQDPLGLADAHGDSGGVALLLKDLSGAEAHFRASLENYETTQDIRSTAYACWNLATTAYRQGDRALAQAFAERSSRLYREIGDKKAPLPEEILMRVAEEAEAAARQEHPARF